MAIATSYRIAFVLDIGLGMLSVLIYYFISKAVSATDDVLGSAPNYFAFAAVGAVIGIVIQGATYGLTRRLREEQLTGTLEVLTTEPVAPAQIALGLAAFPFLFAAARALLYLILAALFLNLDLTDADWLGFTIMLLLTGLSISGIGVLVGGLVMLMNRGESLAPLITLALSLLGGAFFPLEVLPRWAELLGRMTPTHYIFDGIRDALFTGAGWSGDALVLLPFSVFGLPVAVAIFSRAIRRARDNGTLGQY